MTLSEPMERDLRSIMRRLRAYGAVAVYMRVSSGVLRLFSEGSARQFVANYALNSRATFEQVGDMIREDVAYEIAKQCSR